MYIERTITHLKNQVNMRTISAITVITFFAIIAALTFRPNSADAQVKSLLNKLQYGVLFGGAYSLGSESEVSFFQTGIRIGGFTDITLLREKDEFLSVVGRLKLTYDRFGLSKTLKERWNDEYDSFPVRQLISITYQLNLIISHGNNGNELYLSAAAGHLFNKEIQNDNFYFSRAEAGRAFNKWTLSYGAGSIYPDIFGRNLYLESNYIIVLKSQSEDEKSRLKFLSIEIGTLF